MPPHGQEVYLTDLEAAILGAIGKDNPKVTDKETIGILLSLIAKVKGG